VLCNENTACLCFAVVKFGWSKIKQFIAVVNDRNLAQVADPVIVDYSSKLAHIYNFFTLLSLCFGMYQ
jgi:hypothetical protein